MLDIAIEAAKAAGELAYRYFKNLPEIKYKPDDSPVTRADIETEKLIRKIISKKFPDHGLIGEELPPVNPNARFQWVIDPIDGTRDYIRHISYWAIFVAVLDQGKPIIGIAHFPAINKLVIAEKNRGTFINGKKTKVSKTKKLKHAYVTSGTIKRFIQTDTLHQFVNLCRQTETNRSYGNLSLKYLLEAKIDVIIEPFGAIHDFAAPAILVTEAGGNFTDFGGKFSLTSGNAVFTNGLLHDQVIKILNSK